MRERRGGGGKGIKNGKTERKSKWVGNWECMTEKRWKVGKLKKKKKMILYKYDSAPINRSGAIGKYSTRVYEGGNETP